MDEAGVSLSQEKPTVAGMEDLPPTQQEEETLPPTQQEESVNLCRDHTQVTAAPSAADVGRGRASPPVHTSPEESIADRTFGFLLGLPRGSALELP